ncbi:MAG: polysaccharide biosynthesis tyrosine autokinase [Acidobacteriota bacterium]|nr:polysaccharide biosynthesis tyrosine autokinase [Acidobacteriota bacterium]
MREPRESIKENMKGWGLVPYDAVAPAPTMNGHGAEGAADEESTLRSYWRAVRKHQWLVVGITAFVTMMTAIYMVTRPDIYEAQARVQINLEDNQTLGSSNGGSIIVSNPANDPAYFNTQLQILTGPGLLRRVVKTLDLEHNEDFLRPQSVPDVSTWESLQRMVGLNPDNGGTDVSRKKREEVPLTGTVAPATSREDLVEARRLARYVASLQNGLKVEPVKETRLSIKETRLIDVRFLHADAQVTAKVVNAIADTFVLSNLERKAETGITAGGLLQKRIAELQSQIRSGEERRINYAKNHDIISLDPSQNTVVERLAGLNRQLLEAENERQMAEAAYRASLTPGAAEALAEETSKQTAAAETRLGELQQRRAQLLVENTEDWPEVKEVNQQIATLERYVRDSRKRSASIITTNLRTRYNQTLAREQALQTSYKKQSGRMLKQNEAAVTYRMIEQEVDTNKNLLNGLLQRAKENEVLMAGAQNNVHVVDYAIAPENSIGPKRLRTVCLALVLALASGIGLALLLDHLDNTVHSSEDVERWLQLPALVAIPSAGALEPRRLLSTVGALQTGNGGKHSELLVNADARSPLAEAYRHLRTSVLLSTPGGVPKTLLVTSSQAGEGKTTTAVNIAMSLAQTGASVLIIDADMRKPEQHSIFGRLNHRGLSSFLSNEMRDTELFAMIEKHEASGLRLLTSGPMPPNPAELLGSAQMHRLLVTLESTFTHIIIDSPPISSFTDGVLLSAVVDGVLLVVHSGKTPRDVVRHSQRILQDVGARVLGVILNNVKLRPHDYYYYQRYNGRSLAKSNDFSSGTANNLNRLN